MPSMSYSQIIMSPYIVTQHLGACTLAIPTTTTSHIHCSGTAKMVVTQYSDGEVHLQVISYPCHSLSIMSPYIDTNVWGHACILHLITPECLCGMLLMILRKEDTE